MEGEDGRAGPQTEAHAQPPTQAPPAVHAEHKPDKSERERQGKPEEKPSKFEWALKKTDLLIVIFTVVSGAGAAVSAGAALYTASQIKGSSDQVERAIGKIGDAASAAQSQSKAMNAELGLLGQQIIEAKAQTKSSQTLATNSGISTESSVRAWLHVDHPAVGVIGPLNTIETTYQITNIGHEPAIEVRSEIRPFWFKPTMTTDEGGGLHFTPVDQPVPVNDTCTDILKRPAIGAIWPAGPGAYINGPGRQPIKDGFLSGKLYYGAQGCIAYRTLGKIHYTRFCNFLEADPSLPFAQWQTAFCVGRGQQDAN